MQCLKKESFSTLYTLDIQHSYCEGATATAAIYQKFIKEIASLRSQ